VGQLRQRRIPESIEALTAGASTVVFVRAHLVTFRPRSGPRFGQQ
jgi:hypothetical protein